MNETETTAIEPLGVNHTALPTCGTCYHCEHRDINVGLCRLNAPPNAIMVQGRDAKGNPVMQIMLDPFFYTMRLIF